MWALLSPVCSHLNLGHEKTAICSFPFSSLNPYTFEWHTFSCQSLKQLMTYEFNNPPSMSTSSRIHIPNSYPMSIDLNRKGWSTSLLDLPTCSIESALTGAMLYTTVSRQQYSRLHSYHESTPLMMTSFALCAVRTKWNAYSVHQPQYDTFAIKDWVRSQTT